MGNPLIRKIFFWLIFFPSGAAFIIFLVINRHTVMISFWPLGFAPEVRLYAVILGVLAVGVLWGGLAVWLAGRSQRRKGREARRLGERVTVELSQAKQQIHRLETEIQEARSTNRGASIAPAGPV